ncbi:uncharacterized protein TNCV_2101541 [Trichonephila clavipes]|nr:uncharacterized protein TNCV_2101541 [Trichonephila clavipes]
MEYGMWTFPSTSAIVEHRQCPKSIMVWGGICASEENSFVFVEEGVKINQKVNQKYILEAVVLLWAPKHVGNADWTFH